MKIYKLEITAYDYYYKCDKDGFVTIDKYFTTMEKAEKWMADNPAYIYRGFDKNDTTADKKWKMPKFKVVEIEVE